MKKKPEPVIVQPCPKIERVIKTLEALRLIHLAKGDISTAHTLQGDLIFLRPPQKAKTHRKIASCHA